MPRGKKAYYGRVVHDPSTEMSATPSTVRGLGVITRNPNTLGSKSANISRFDKYVIRMNDSRIVFWDVLLLTMLFYETWSIPFEIGVAGGHLWRVAGILGLLISELVNAVFLSDTVLNFFRETRDSDGKLVWRSRDISSRYLRGWFIPDILSCVPVDTIAYATQAPRGSTLFHTLIVLQILRLFRLSRINRRLRASPTLSKFSLRLSMVPLQIAFIFGTSVYVAHCMACVWCFTANLEDDGSKTWVDKYLEHQVTALQPIGDTFQNVMDLYILGLYWASVTLVSIGYGDVTPYTRAEYWVCATCILVGAALWAWVVASMVDLVSQTQKSSNELETHLAVVNRYALQQRKKLRDPQSRKNWDSLMDESRIYLKTVHTRKHKTQKNDEFLQAMDALSPFLRMRVAIAQTEHTILRVTYLAAGKSSTVAFLAEHMTQESFALGEVVVDEDGDVLNRERMLYFISNGTCWSSDRPRDVDSAERGEDSSDEAATSGGGRKPYAAARVARNVVAGQVAVDVEPKRSYYADSKMSLICEGSIWDVDRFVLERSSPCFRPGRLIALSFCETVALPRKALLEAMTFDFALKKAVKWRIAKIALFQFMKESKLQAKSGVAPVTWRDGVFDSNTRNAEGFR